MDKSPFAKLSAELRNAIYHEVLVEPDGIYLLESGRTTCIRTKDGSSYYEEHLSLTATCRQIHEESHQIVFAANVFHVRNVGKSYYDVDGQGYVGASRLKRNDHLPSIARFWVLQMGTHAGLVRTLDIDFGPDVPTFRHIMDLREIFDDPKTKIRVRFRLSDDLKQASKKETNGGNTLELLIGRDDIDTTGLVTAVKNLRGPEENPLCRRWRFFEQFRASVWRLHRDLSTIFSEL